MWDTSCLLTSFLRTFHCSCWLLLSWSLAYLNIWNNFYKSKVWSPVEKSANLMKPLLLLSKFLRWVAQPATSKTASAYFLWANLLLNWKRMAPPSRSDYFLWLTRPFAQLICFEHFALKFTGNSRITKSWRDSPTFKPTWHSLEVRIKFSFGLIFVIKLTPRRGFTSGICDSGRWIRSSDYSTYARILCTDVNLPETKKSRGIVWGNYMVPSWLDSAVV